MDDRQGKHPGFSLREHASLSSVRQSSDTEKSQLCKLVVALLEEKGFHDLAVDVKGDYDVEFYEKILQYVRIERDRGAIEKFVKESLKPTYIEAIGLGSRLNLDDVDGPPQSISAEQPQSISAEQPQAISAEQVISRKYSPEGYKVGYNRNPRSSSGENLPIKPDSKEFQRYAGNEPSSTSQRSSTFTSQFLTGAQFSQEMVKQLSQISEQAYYQPQSTIKSTAFDNHIDRYEVHLGRATIEIIKALCIQCKSHVCTSRFVLGLRKVYTSREAVLAHIEMFRKEVGVIDALHLEKWPDVLTGVQLEPCDASNLREAAEKLGKYTAVDRPLEDFLRSTHVKPMLFAKAARGEIQARKTLAGGTFGNVALYSATDSKKTHFFVMKSIKKIHTFKPNEVTLFADCDYKYLCAPHTVSTYGDSLFLAMDYKGKDLRRLWENRAGDDDDEEEEMPTVKYMHTLLLSLAKGLVWLATRKITHKDIKPANILQRGKDEQPVFCITDMGAAVHADENLSYDQYKTGATPAYMSPEFAQVCLAGEVEFNNNPVKPNPAQDMWAAVLVLFYVQEKEYPFNAREFGKDHNALWRKIVEVKHEHPLEGFRNAHIMGRTKDYDLLFQVFQDVLCPVERRITAAEAVQQLKFLTPNLPS